MGEDREAALTRVFEDVRSDRCYGKLFLRSVRDPSERLWWHRRSVAELPLPEGYLPRDFEIVDACLTNCANIGTWKHLYL